MVNELLTNEEKRSFEIFQKVIKTIDKDLQKWVKSKPYTFKFMNQEFISSFENEKWEGYLLLYQRNSNQKQVNRLLYRKDSNSPISECTINEGFKKLALEKIHSYGANGGEISLTLKEIEAVGLSKSLLYEKPTLNTLEAQASKNLYDSAELYSTKHEINILQAPKSLLDKFGKINLMQIITFSSQPNIYFCNQIYRFLQKESKCCLEDETSSFLFQLANIKCLYPLTFKELHMEFSEELVHKQNDDHLKAWGEKYLSKNKMIYEEFEKFCENTKLLSPEEKNTAIRTTLKDYANTPEQNTLTLKALQEFNTNFRAPKKNPAEELKNLNTSEPLQNVDTYPSSKKILTTLAIATSIIIGIVATVLTGGLFPLVAGIIGGLCIGLYQLADAYRPKEEKQELIASLEKHKDPKLRKKEIEEDVKEEIKVPNNSISAKKEEDLTSTSSESIIPISKNPYAFWKNPSNTEEPSTEQTEQTYSSCKIL